MAKVLKIINGVSRLVEIDTGGLTTTEVTANTTMVAGNSYIANLTTFSNHTIKGFN